jgi:hypothetical protein
MSNKGCILEISFLACFIDTFPVGSWLVGNGDYKATSVAIAIASLTELGNKCGGYFFLQFLRLLPSSAQAQTPASV